MPKHPPKAGKLSDLPPHLRRLARRPKIIKVNEHAGRKVASLNALELPGDYCFMPRGRCRCPDGEIRDAYELALILPGQTTRSSIIVVKTKSVVRDPQVADHIWNWDGNEDRPTVNPEIMMGQASPGEKWWRGYLLNGAFTSTP